MSKKIGIIGGMGPLATSDLFNKIVTLTDAKCDNDHIRILIDNNTEIPDRTDCIVNNGKDPAKHLIESALLLEKMGADVLIMPCNTAHYFYDEIVKHINIPFIHMIEETAKEVKRIHVDKKIGLLATQGTCASGIYDKIFNQYGLELTKPDSSDQEYVTELIYDIKKGKVNIDLTNFKRVLKSLGNQGAEAFVLGCTELPVAFQTYGIDAQYIDPTKILACSTIKFAGKKIKDI